MPDYPDLPELPQNAILLDYLRPEAKPAEDQSRLGKWEMRAHPDLAEWMESLAPGQPVHAAYGAPVLTAAGVAAVVAIGTDHMLLRLWSVPDDLKTGIPTPPLTDQGWRLVDAWQNQLSRPDWKRRLSALIKLALWQASVPYYPDLPTPRTPHSLTICAPTANPLRTNGGSGRGKFVRTLT